MKSSQQWMEEQFGVWQHPTTDNWMGMIEWSAGNFKELVEQIQLDAFKAGMTHAANLVATRCFCSEEGHAGSQHILTTRDNLKEIPEYA